MKHLLLITFLGLSACAHETTTLDRELALKLVDKAGRIEIVQSGTPVVSVNQPMAQLAATSEQDTRTNCINSPVYNVSGTFLHYVRQCVGGN
jgi:hypothetical protein